MDIVELDPRSAAAADLGAWHDVLAAVTAHDLPDDPVPALSDTVADLRHPFASRPAVKWLGVVGGAPSATCSVQLLAAPNDRIGRVDVQVAPALRRQGIGRAMLAVAVDRLRAEGRTHVGGEAAGGTDGAGFAGAMGLRAVLSDHRGILRMAELAADDLDSLVRGVPAGYRVLRWHDHVPDQRADAYCVAKAAMADAPRGDLVERKDSVDRARLRSIEDTMRRRGKDWRVVVAVHQETGTVAGLTEIAVPAGNPHRATQEDTAVVQAHRGHGLGLVVKAEMLRWLRAERPDVVDIQTWNAQSNAHMLVINDRLGFRRDREWVAYQADVEVVAERLRA